MRLGPAPSQPYFSGVEGGLVPFFQALQLVGYGVAGSVYATLRLGGQAAGYVVPSGRELLIFSVRASATLGVGSVEIRGLYGDNDVGFNSGTGPTSRVFLDGSSGGSGSEAARILALISASLANEVGGVSPMVWRIPAGKLPAVRISGLAGAVTQVVGFGVLV